MFETIKKLLSDPADSNETAHNLTEVNYERYKEYPPGEWTERDMNKWLKRLISDNRQSNNVLAFTRHISIELEDNNHVKIIVMSKYYFQVRFETELIDMWHDHRTSSITLKINRITLSEVPLLPRFISENISYILLTVFGFVFRLKDQSLLRLNGETVHIDMHNYLASHDDPVITRYIRDDSGQLQHNYFIIGVQTSRGVLKPVIHQLSGLGRDRSNRTLVSTCKKTEPNIFNKTDIWQLSLVAMVVSVCVVLLHPFLKLRFNDFSLTWSFFSSLGFLILSLLIINMARQIYTIWLRLRTSYRKVEFKAEDNNYKLERLKREIELEMDKLKVTNQSDFEKALFRASRYRGRAGEINRELEIANVERKIKYGTAYIVAVISEVIAYNLYSAFSSYF